VRLLYLVAVVAFALAGAAAAAAPERHLVLVDERTGAVDRSFPDQQLEAAVADGRGGWIVALPSALVRLDRHGHVDGSWHADLPDGAPGRLARSGRRLYATIRRPGRGASVVAVDAATGKRLWVAPTFRMPAPGGGLTGLAADARAVYVAGAFGRVGSERRASVAALDARTGRLLPWRMPAVGPLAYNVSVLTVSGPRLYVGGSFGRVAGRSAPGVAAVSTRSGALLPWRPRFSSDETTAIAVVGRTVLVGGTFGFGAYDARTARPRAWSSEVHGSPTVFGVAGRAVYLGGNLRSGFDAVGSVRANNLGAVDAVSGGPLGLAPDLATFVTVGVLAPSGGKLLVGGSFSASIG
jgi:outer membrane protein assembly factor BamB